MAAEENKVKTWMKKEGIFDNDVCEILVGQGVVDPETDFKTYTQAQWDELWRKGAVERAKELKDQQAKVNHEKKLKKLEKFWRKESGIKLSSIKNDGDDEKKAKPLENSAAAQADALQKGAEIKKYLQKNQCFSPDLVLVLVQTSDITCEEDLSKLDTQKKFDEVYRQIRVIRAQELKDQASKVRMEKMMTKFEKLWRAKTGIKKTSIQKKKKGGKKKDPKTAKNEAMSSGGAELKKWMRKNDVWEMALYDELMARNIDDPEKLGGITESKFDEIVRKVRVDRFSQLKDQQARNRADKLLVKFEKEWRKKSGIKKTSIK